MFEDVEDGLLSASQLDQIRQDVLGKWGELQVISYYVLLVQQWCFVRSSHLSLTCNLPEDRIHILKIMPTYFSHKELYMLYFYLILVYSRTSQQPQSRK